MPATLSRIISTLRGLRRPSAPKPSPYVQQEHFLQMCNDSHVEVQIVIDTALCPINPGPLPASIDDSAIDLSREVVLAVGINYGQGHDYCKHPWFPPASVVMMDDTGMRPKIDSLASQWSKSFPKAKFPKHGEYHLIATNIFPFITGASWAQLELNGIEEAKVLQDYWTWATTLLDQLVPELVPDYLIFHGANNAVPLFGMSYVLKGYLYCSPRAEIFLCDNLAKPSVKIHNCEIL
jgi:hypothetical protein